MQHIDINQDVDELNISVCESILGAAKQAIQREGGKKKKKIVPWWTKECENAIKSGNKAFKVLKRTHIFPNSY